MSARLFLFFCHQPFFSFVLKLLYQRLLFLLQTTSARLYIVVYLSTTTASYNCSCVPLNKPRCQKFTPWVEQIWDFLMIWMLIRGFISNWNILSISYTRSLKVFIFFFVYCILHVIDTANYHHSNDSSYNLYLLQSVAHCAI